MECRAYGICLDSQSRGYLGKDRKVSSAAGGNLSRMHKTQETAKESRLNFMYSHLRNRTLEGCGELPLRLFPSTSPSRTGVVCISSGFPVSKKRPQRTRRSQSRFDRDESSHRWNTPTRPMIMR